MNAQEIADLTAGYFTLTDGRVGKSCWKCAGTGFLPEYAGIHNGVCYACNGRKYTRTDATREAAAKYEARLIKTRTARQAAAAAKRDANTAAFIADREAKEAAAAVIAAAEYDAWATTNPALAAWVETVRVNRPERAVFVLDFAPSRETGARLTPGQANLLSKIHGEAVANAAITWVHLPAGKGEKATFTGTVTKAMTLEGNYGYTTTYTRLILVEVITPDGVATVKMTTTALWAGAVEKDQTVTVTATVKDHGSYNGRPQTVVTRPKLTA
jgi:hypothetical protein